MSGLLVAVLLAASGASPARVPVTAASAQANATAREALGLTFKSVSELKKSRIYGEAVAIGPRLWAAAREARRQFPTVTKDTYAVVPSREIVERWKLEAVDLSTLPEGLRTVLSEAAKEGTPVVGGAVFQRSSEVVPQILLTAVSPEELPFSVRTVTDAELEYYYSLVPYELSEPLWAVQSKAHSFLFQFDNAGRVTYVELL